MQPVPLAPGAQPEPEGFGCGWFDSSLDLREGLEVTEHAGPDAVADALGLDLWWRLHLAFAHRPRSCAMITG